MTQAAYQYRFYPTPEQENLLRRTLGCTCLVYNRALAMRIEAWKERHEKLNYTHTSTLLTQWKRQEELNFLNEVSCVPLQQGLRHLQKAFINFFAGRARYPRFKRKANGGSAEFTKSGFRYRDGEVYLAKCQEPLAIRWSRLLPEGVIPTSITVCLTPSNRWYVSLRVDIDVEPLPTTDSMIGLDLGITNLVALSNGQKLGNPKHFQAKQRKLRQAQKALSRKQKGSNNRYKARLKVARVHAEIADARRDQLHKLTTQLIRENQTIAVEDLAVKNMVKNRKLARAISDAGWGELVRQLKYKAEWYGRELVKIDRWFPSTKRCSSCSHTVEKMPLSVREWECPECGTYHDRDTNAALNILAAGLAVSACGASVRRSLRSSRSLHPRDRRPE
ncbi:MAG: IS200/IS605 family element transposase accessory protein TnpB [Coleofasciculaceae cyanobacterium RL_1_1]|nr:IS200/IS605 family element transposase accessory protein TnpB [Coleofasciculaceae cyanobacterium RL_1_1]